MGVWVTTGVGTLVESSGLGDVKGDMATGDAGLILLIGGREPRSIVVPLATIGTVSRGDKGRVTSGRDVRIGLVSVIYLRIRTHSVRYRT